MTSLQVIDTGEVVEQMTRVEAERITARIADKLDGIADNIEQVMPLIRDALTREAWRPLGYTGATAYVSERFAGAFKRLPATVRRPIVAELSSAGMSTRAIAPIVGVSNKTVHQDSQVLPRVTRAPRFVDTTTGEIHEGPISDPTPPKVTGVDGKTYQRPAPVEPSKPRRRPIQDAARDAGWDLRKAVERIERLTSDDRFSSNKEEVATQVRGHLLDAIDSCQGILDRLSTEKES